MSEQRYNLWAFFVLFLTVTAVWGQDNNAQPPADANTGNTQQPVPAYGPENAVPSISENPPISG